MKKEENPGLLTSRQVGCSVTKALQIFDTNVHFSLSSKKKIPKQLYAPFTKKQNPDCLTVCKNRIYCSLKRQPAYLLIDTEIL